MPKQDYLRRSPLKFDDPDYQKCYAYWLSLKDDRWAPAWGEWQWMELPVILIPYFLVVDVSYEPLDFVYRFWGTAYTTMHDIDMTNQSLNEIRSPVTAKNTIEHYTEVVNSRQAVGSTDTIQAGLYDTSHIQTSLRMPMSDNGARVDQIVTFADWRKEHEEIKIEHIKAFGE